MGFRLIKYQKFFIILLVIFILFISLISYKKASDEKLQWIEPKAENLQNCNNNLCVLTREAITKNNKLSVIFLIFKKNINAQYRIILDNTIYPKYLFLVPFVASTKDASAIGTLFYTNKQKLLTDLLFPHGIIEISAGILSASLYYAFIINLVYIFLKKRFKEFNTISRQTFIQIGIIVTLYFISAILEGLSVSYKLNIINWF